MFDYIHSFITLFIEKSSIFGSYERLFMFKSNQLFAVILEKKTLLFFSTLYHCVVFLQLVVCQLVLFFVYTRFKSLLLQKKTKKITELWIDCIKIWRLDQNICYSTKKTKEFIKDFVIFKNQLKPKWLC
jgi:hypothetical protein